MFRTARLRSAAAVAAVAMLAGGAAAQTVSTFNQVYSGPRNTAATDGSLSSSVSTARSNSFTLAQLGAGGSATLRTTISINAQAASTSPQLGINVFGFLRNVDPGTPIYSQARYDDDPLIYFQPNDGAGPGTGQCVNSEFNRNGTFNGSDFVFGMGANYKCAVPRDNAGQTATQAGSFANYTLRLNANGTFVGTIDFLDALGAPVTNLGDCAAASGPTCSLTISGTVADLNATYTPFLRLRPGYDTGAGLTDPNTPWSFTVTNSSLDVTAAVVPEPATSVLMAGGLLGIAAAARRRRRA